MSPLHIVIISIFLWACIAVVILGIAGVQLGRAWTLWKETRNSKNRSPR